MKNIRVLFICKKRSTYGVSYGLVNSCRFLINALVDMGFEAQIVEVTDNNDIDKEVSNYKPTHVFIEALWVVPDKFNVLISLHPKVQWYVRLHSNVPFIAGEGMAMDWISKYLALSIKYRNFHLAANAREMVEDISDVFVVDTEYAPNIYQPFPLQIETLNRSENGPHPHPSPKPDPIPKTINVGCFGAIRPLKNQLIQAMAAIAFANCIGTTMTFHINSTRIESHGEPILKNIQALFDSTQHKLAVHDWIPWSEFIQLVLTMDLGLQVSFSETFDIVAADFVFAHVPIVGSKEISWLSPHYQADCTNMTDIVQKLQFAWQGKRFGLHSANRTGLKEWNEQARRVWKHLLLG